MHIFAVRGLIWSVHLVHIAPMNRLQQWMAKSGTNDAQLAELVKNKPTRSQISRIRRNESGASKATAHKLEQVTGIPWHEFIGGGP